MSATVSNAYALGDVQSTGSGDVTGGGLIGVLNASIQNTYAAGESTVTGSTFSGGLLGFRQSGASITGIHHFAGDSGGTNGVGSGTCGATVCIQATGSDYASRLAWLENTLDETDNAGLNWDSALDSAGEAIWGNLNMPGFPCLRNMPSGAPVCN